MLRRRGFCEGTSGTALRKDLLYDSRIRRGDRIRIRNLAADTGEVVIFRTRDDAEPASICHFRNPGRSTGQGRHDDLPLPCDGRGTAFSGVIGYRFAGGLRIEGELGYRKAGFDEITLREPGSLAALLPPEQRQEPAVLESLKGTHPAEGDLSSVSLMVSLYYDIDLASGLKPYVGGGIGLSRVSMKASTAGTQTTDDDDTVFAYQFGAGIGYGIGTWSGRPVIVSLDFRHHATADPTLTGSVTGTPFDIGVGGNHVGVGLRIGF